MTFTTRIAVLSSLLACAVSAQESPVVATQSVPGVTTSVYATDGHVVSKTESVSGAVVIPNLSADGHSSWVDDGKGGRTSYVYDAAGHVVQIAKSHPGEDTVVYDAAGAVIDSRKGEATGVQQYPGGAAPMTKPVEKPSH